MDVRFGTDGIRGVANADLGVELVLALGRAAARVLPAGCFVVGRDTRRSGPLLQSALSVGLASEGADVVDVGVLPTPAVAWLSAERAVPAAVVSASHNLFADNGVKLFAAGGSKLSDATEESVEAELERILSGSASGSGSGHAVRPTGRAVGELSVDTQAAESYVEHLVSLAGRADLSGLHVVVDCANGAASTVAPAVLRRLGARVDPVSDRPDGTNINAGCGSTHPEALAAEVRARGADVGLALDGDADRLVAVDHHGELVTGDELLAMFALDLAARGELAGHAVVVTVMSNLGLRLAMEAHGIAVRETPVGDRYVLEALEADGLALGGEQSGHIVFRRLSTTGDGTLTGVLLLELLARAGRPLAELARGSMQRLPQVLQSVSVERPTAVVESDPVRKELDAVRLALGESGRVVLRASGTEPVVRVMVEATDQKTAVESAERLVQTVTSVAEAEARRPLSP
ncbi:MAG TPA: phosphoglucosamine mutase [Acidimicrobiales bacterium]|nr:phosphoglucosamine mutase [Acidimicrobiales bacterium]